MEIQENADFIDQLRNPNIFFKHLTLFSLRKMALCLRELTLHAQT